MKLLIITQKVDIEDDVLGFFHCWIEKFAQKVDSLNVICLQKGKYSLPTNVRVFSLGKERYLNLNESNFIRIIRMPIRKFGLALRFYKYIWQLRKAYDIVFVHMNPIYVILGWFFWRIWRKKIFLWYIHRSLKWQLILAGKLVDKIFTISSDTCRIKNKEKLFFVGHGIDTEIFKREETVQKIPNSILYLGRISPIKNVNTLIKAANLLDDEGIDFVLNIVGEPGEPDKEYFEEIKRLSKKIGERGKIRFLGKVPNYKTPKIYNQNEIFVNLTSCGSLDKTIFEAMACENLILVSNKYFQEILPKECFFKESNTAELTEKIKNLFNLLPQTKENYCRKLREYVVNNHSLDKLIEKLIYEFEKPN